MRKIDLSKIKVTGVANNSVLVYNNVSSSWVASNTVAANVDWSYIGNVPYANSTANGVVKIVDSTANTSNSIAASANSVKVAFDAALANGATAYANAVTYTNSLAATAYSNAVSTASGDATTKAATAYSNAVTYAGTIAGTAYSNAVTYAGTIAATAYSNATSYADTKAATAYSNAVGYAASNTYVNSTFAPLASPTFTGTVSANNVSITGNLTISGTTTYVNSTNLNIGDNIITLNADVTGVTAPTENAGIEVNRGSAANVQLRWNETLDVWQITVDGTNFLTVASNTDVSTAYSNSVSYANSTFLKLSGGTMTGAVSGITTLAAGNTTITGFANVSANLNTSGTLSANVITVTGNVTTTQNNLQVDAAGTATAMSIVFGG